MKIALLAARMPPACDGVGDHADRLAQTLSERGHDVFAMTIPPVTQRADCIPRCEALMVGAARCAGRRIYAVSLWSALARAARRIDCVSRGADPKHPRGA